MSQDLSTQTVRAVVGLLCMGILAEFSDARIPRLQGTAPLSPVSPPAPLPINATPPFSLSDQIDLPRLVDLCAQRLRLTVEYDAAIIKGTVTLRQGEPFSDDELWLLTNRLLASRGFTTVRAPGDNRTFSVVRVTDAAGATQVVGAEAFLAATGPQAGFVSVMVRSTHRPAKELAEVLKAVLGKGTGTVAELAGGSAGGLGNAGGAEGNDRSGPGAAGDGAPVDTAGAGGAGAGSGGSGGLLIITDLAPRVRQALSLLPTIDTPTDRVMVVDVALKNLSATQLTTLIGQVAAKQAAQTGRKATGDVLAAPSGGSVLVVAPQTQIPVWQALIEQLDQREATQTVHYSARYFGVKDVGKLVEQAIKDGTGPGNDDRARVVVDDLTGTLIVTATPAQQDRVRELIERLDSVAPAARRPIRTFVIRNRPVREMVDVVTRLLSAGVLSGLESADGAALSGLAPSGGGTALLPTVPPVASPTPVSSGASLLRNTPVSETRTTGVRPNGVGTQGQNGLPAELSLTSDETTNTLIAIGEPRVLARLETLLTTLDIRQSQVMLEVLLVSLSESQTLALGAELERLTNVGDAQIRLSSLFGISTTNSTSTSTTPGGAGGTVTVLSPGEFSIVIRALESVNEGRSLSIPRILVGNNQKGEFNAVTQQPVATTVTPSSQVTTTSFGGYEPAGTTVSVQPQIAPGDHLTLSYSVTLSSFSGAGTGGLPPPRQENRLQSQVTIPDAYTVAVGGIELVSTSEGVTQVPLLGSIPIIGEAFKNRSSSTSRTRFYAFIRAEVLRREGFEDLKYVSDQATAAGGVDDGFPEVEPLIIR